MRVLRHLTPAALLLAAACSRGHAPTTPAPKRVTQTGTASWYGPGFNGKPTTSGETYDQNLLTAAHRTFPLGTRVRVTNVSNEKQVDVRINDRGPFVGDRIIDLSFAAASAIGMIGPGTAQVLLEVLDTPIPIAGVPKSIRYTVQLGAFTTKDAAEAARKRLEKTVRQPEIVATRTGGQTLYRVRFGDFADVESARSAAQRLQREGTPAIVVERN